MQTWKFAEYPGYLGKARESVYSIWDKKYGPDNWRIVYCWAGKIVEREFALQLYEDAYYMFLNDPKNIKVLDWLRLTASDVYDTAPSNVGQMDYIRQETPNNHIHDVAIRRAVLRLGVLFAGDHLVHVRGEDSEGYRLCPGEVPFHLPGMILKSAINDYGKKGEWWKGFSIEDFYQRNKILQIKE